MFFTVKCIYDWHIIQWILFAIKQNVLVCCVCVHCLLLFLLQSLLTTWHTWQDNMWASETMNTNQSGQKGNGISFKMNVLSKWLRVVFLREIQTFFLPQPSLSQWIKMSSPYCESENVVWHKSFFYCECVRLVLVKSWKPFLLKFFFFSLLFLFHTHYTILMTFSKNFTVRMKSFTFQPIFWKIFFFPFFHSFWLQFLSLSCDIYWIGCVCVCMVWFGFLGLRMKSEQRKKRENVRMYEQTPACK